MTAPRGPFTRLGQPPRNKNGFIDPFEMGKWFDRLWKILSAIPGIAWDIVDKTGSKLSDITERPHSMLQDILGWATGTDTVQDKHISEADGKVWQDHVEASKNVHGIGETSSVVGTATSQEISNKIFDSSNKYGGDVNYTGFEADGTMVFHGDATVWDDVYPSSVTVGTTGANFPTFTSYNGNLKAYEFVGTGVNPKEINMGFQFYHSYLEGSDIIPHLHLFIPDDASGGVIKFYCEYTWTNFNQTGAVTTTTVSGTITRASNAGIANNDKLSFGAISGTGKTVSSVFMCRIYRDPSDVTDTFGASVWLKSADIHIVKDTAGSRSELVK